MDILLGPDDSPFAAGQGSLRRIYRDQDFCSSTLPLLPQQKSFSDSIGLAVVTARGNSLPHKRFLIGG